MTWELTEALLTEFRFATSGDQPCDAVRMSVSKVCSIFEGVDDHGKPAGKVEACWDVKTGTP